MKRKSPLALLTLLAAVAGMGGQRSSNVMTLLPPIGGFCDPRAYSLLRTVTSGPPPASFGRRPNQRQRRKARRQLYAAGARRSVAFA
jgi:hypothetical protein